LDEAQEYINGVSPTPENVVGRHILQGALFKRKNNYSAAAASFRIALKFLENSNQATNEQLSSLTRMINTLDENAMAAPATTGQNLARRSAESQGRLYALTVAQRSIRASLRPVSWSVSSTQEIQVVTVQLKVRARTVNFYYLFGWCCPQMTGASTSFAFYNSGRVTVPFLFYSNFVKKSVPSAPALWNNCAWETALIQNPTCFQFGQTPGFNLRVSWTFF